MSYTNYRLPRQAQPDAVITAVELANVSSKSDEPDRKQWTDIRIFRLESGRYVTYIVGRSLIEGHRDRITFNVVEKAEDVKDALRINNRPYLTDLAMEALEDAAEADPALAVNLVETFS